MKWTNKGHELDQYAKKLTAGLQNRNKSYIFGAGKLGKTLLPLFKNCNREVVFIDNDTE